MYLHLHIVLAVAPAKKVVSVAGQEVQEPSSFELYVPSAQFTHWLFISLEVPLGHLTKIKRLTILLYISLSTIYTLAI
jgi:hypothetical protein